jgi:hypothetical protein
LAEVAVIGEIIASCCIPLSLTGETSPLHSLLAVK